MNVPAGFTPAEIDSLKAANPGVVMALALTPNETVPPAVEPSRALGWLDILEIPLEAGEAIALPGPIGAFLAGLTKTGIAALRAKLTGAAPTERWTVDRMKTEIATALVLPKT